MKTTILLVLLLSFGQAFGGQFLQLKVGQGYLAKAKQKRSPVVVIVPDVRGVNALIKAEAERWANDYGISALAVDFYRGQTFTDDNSAETAKENLDHDYFVRVLTSAFEFFKKRTQDYDSNKLVLLVYPTFSDSLLKLIPAIENVNVVVMLSPSIPVVMPDLSKTKADFWIFAPTVNPEISRQRYMGFEKSLKDLKLNAELTSISTAKRQFWDYIKTGTYDSLATETYRKAIKASIQKRWPETVHAAAFPTVIAPPAPPEPAPQAAPLQPIQPAVPVQPITEKK